MPNYIPPSFAPGDTVMYYDTDKYPVIAIIETVRYSNLHKGWVFFLQGIKTCKSASDLEAWFPGKVIAIIS